jgi:hypothetical protein
MKQKFIFLKIWLSVLISGLLSLSIAFTQTATLKHSYTFEDGTAKDVVGNADGTVNGGTIANGAYTASANGHHIELPANIININTYSAITIEAYIRADVDVTWASMMAYFGDTETSSGNNWGVNYYFITPDRWSQCATAISCGVTTNPWSGEDGLTGSPVSVGNKHHVVGILTNSNISLYIDGLLVGSQALSKTNNLISNISNAKAYICKGGYGADPTWQGTIFEYNIYDGVLDENVIQEHYVNFMGSDFFDARLSSLTTNTCKLEPAFDPEVEMYEIKVDYGITSLKLDAVAKIKGATVKIFDGLGKEISDGIVNFDIKDGIDVQILVTALDKSTQKSYYVSIFVNNGEKSANLSSIELSTGKILNKFHPDTTKYKALVPYGTTSVVINGKPSWSGAKVTGDGTIQLSNGFASAIITVKSQDSLTIKKYKVEIYASKIATGKYFYLMHEASGFVVSESKETYNVIKLAPLTKNDSTQLFEIIESGVDSQYFIRNKLNNYLRLSPSSTWDMIMAPSLSNDLDSCRFKIIEFEPGRFRFESVKKSATQQKYMGTNNEYLGGWIYADKYENNKLNVWKIYSPEEIIPHDTYLNSLYISSGTLSPEFKFYIKDYSVILPAGTTSVNVNAVANDPASTVNGTGTINIASNDGIITIKVIASDSKSSTEYRIHYIIDGTFTLRHSYTFANGTAMDMIGNAHGTVNGGIIKNGEYIASQNGQHISFPGDIIRINGYPAITVETYLKDDDNISNDVNTMITYFGNTIGSYGTDYLFTSLKSRIAVSCVNTSNPWSTESGVSGTNLLDDGKPHHLVGILTLDSVILYIDGVKVNQSAVSENNKIYNLSNKYSYLCKSGYVNDKTWMGKVLEYNIYSGKMDAATIASRAANFPVNDSTSDATLSDLKVNNVSLTDFSPYKLQYKVKVPSGTTVVPTVSATPKYNGASANVIPASSLKDTTVIIVTAKDGATKVKYYVLFEEEEEGSQPSQPPVNVINNSEISSHIKVYPTIFRDNFRIESSKEINEVRIFDVSGKEVYKYFGKAYVYDINASFNTGIYFVKVYCSEGIKTFKVFKVK